MALSGTVVWEVRTTGDPANSGGFNSAAAGTDRSQQDAPHVIIDGVTITATVNATTTDLDIVGYAVSAADIGNTVRIAGGTMTAGTYQINSIPAAGRWRLDRSGGVAAQTGTGRMGGAHSDPALVAADTVANNKIWIQSGTYLITSATQNVAGGCISINQRMIEGYQTVRGDQAARPLLQASGINTATLMTLPGNSGQLICVDLDGADLVAIRGINFSGRVTIINVIARRCTNSGVFSTNMTGAFLFRVGVTGCSTAGAGFNATGGTPFAIDGCEAWSNTVSGFSVDAQAGVYNCLAWNNTGATSDGFTATGAGQTYVNCTAHGNGRDGFNNSINGSDCRWINCIAESNVRRGFDGGVASGGTRYNCGAFGNAPNFGGNAPANVSGDVIGTATFFVNAAAGNFALNAAAGAGAAVRSNATPGLYPAGLSTSYPDRGSVQTSGAPGTGGGGSGRLQIGQTWT